MNTKTNLSRAVMLGLMVTLTACNGSNTSVFNDTTDPTEPEFSVSRFSSNSAIVDNSYFPLKPGTTYIYEGVGGAYRGIGIP